MGVNYEIPKWLRIFIFSIGKKKKQKQLLLSNGSWQFESHSAAFEPNGSIQLISSNAFGQFGTGDDILNASRFHKHTIRFMVKIHISFVYVSHLYSCLSLKNFATTADSVIHTFSHLMEIL